VLEQDGDLADVSDGTPRVDPRVAEGVIDVFVYVVVLNLFIQYVPSVLSETFALSLLTAVLLKGVLELVVAVKKRAKKRFHAASTAGGKAAAGAGLWAILVGSKLVVLEAVDLVFADRVSLGGFFSVTGLILVLLLSRAGVRRLLQESAAHRPAGTSEPPHG
jgi:hypothetical protein